jgi:hypothetical protein
MPKIENDDSSEEEEGNIAYNKSIIGQLRDKIYC